MSLPENMPTSASIISLGGPKEAALYFDRVFPADNAHGLLHVAGLNKKADPNCIPMIDQTWDHRVLQSLLGDNDQGYVEYIALALTHLSVWNALKNKEVAGQMAMRGSSSDMFVDAGFDESAIGNEIIDGSFNSKKFYSHLDKKMEGILTRTGFKSSSCWRSSGVDVSEVGGFDKSDTEKFFISLHDLKLVDLDELNWDQIVEFRKDTASRAALRDLRLFFADEFADKDLSYVSDKLHSLIYRHEETTKIWGFETVQKTLSVAISKHSLLSSSIGALAIAAAGAPLSIAAASGVIVTIAACGLEFGKSRIELRKGEVDRPTRYLTHLKNLGKTDG